MNETALAGYRVLELAQDVAGPYAGRLLAGYGAEVIKVEPLQGDQARRQPPFQGDDPHPDKSGLFLYLNQNKKGISLNLETPTGRAILRRLIDGAHAVIEGFAPGYLDSYGLAPEDLIQAKASLVVTSVTPFGQTGPYASFSGGDLVVDALGSCSYVRGDPARHPLYAGGRIVHYAGGLAAFTATLAALRHARLTGEGQQVDVSMMETLLQYNEYFVMFYPVQGVVADRGLWWNQGGRFVPCRDGYSVIAAGPQDRFDAFQTFVGDGLPEIYEERFSTVAGRAQHGDELRQLLHRWAADKEKRELMARGQELRLPFGYVADTAGALDDPQNQARGYFVEVEHPMTGRFKVPGAPFRMSETPFRTEQPAPLWGQHNVDIYCGELGYTRDDLVRLRASGAI